MSKYLPERIFPLKLVEAGRRLNGIISTQSMPRLKRELVEAGADCFVDLTFSRDSGGRAQITGNVESLMTYVCQRCLEPVEIPVTAQVSLRIVNAGSAAPDQNDRNETVEVGEDAVSLYEIIEDELLLSQPYIPIHTWDCSSVLQTHIGPIENDSTDETRPNPFAALASLKKDNTN